jgi:hypothetical protein
MKHASSSWFLSLLAFVPSGTDSAAVAAPPSRADGSERVQEALARLPLAFVENHGQTDGRVRYYAQGARHAFHLTRDEVVLSLVQPPAAGETLSRGVVLALRFLGSDPEVVVEGSERAGGEVSYFIGNDPARWQTGLGRYAAVVYRELWPGVDLALRGQGGTLKYELHVQPGARLADIRFGYDGASALALDEDGGLRIETALGALLDSPPVSTQVIDGVQKTVASRFELRSGAGGLEYGFALGAEYDAAHELVIDPSLDYTTFLGGSSDDTITGIAADAAGNAYVVGVTQSSDFPTTPGAFDRTFAGPSNPTDIFVTKLNPSGTALVYSTFVGTGGFDWGRALAIDSAGNAYVTGQTASQDFPTTGGAFDRTLNTSFFDRNDCIVFKLNAAGSSLAYSTYLGGTSTDDGLAIAVDGNGSAYVAGETTSTDFPTTAGAFDRTNAGSNDVFVTKFNATGSALVYSTFLGGTDNELPGGIFVDASGNATLAGGTRSFEFPTTPGAFDTTHSSAPFDELFDLFVTKLNPGGTGLVYSTFLGGSKSDFGGTFALDAAGNTYHVGGTLSPDFPTTPGTLDPVFTGTSESFVSKLSADGSTLVYSTFLGDVGASGIAIDSGGNAWLAGGTSSATAFTSADGFDRTFNGGGGDAYIAKLNATGSAFLYATFLGGTNNDGAGEIALDPSGNVYVAGRTLSADFPTTAGAFDRTWGGDTSIFWGEAFVVRLGSGLTPPPTPSAPSLLSPANAATVAQPVAFDWSDAANAATYTLQIDDSSAFTTPLTSTQTVSVSQATVSGLPARQLFWRVRGINSVAVAGPFSAVRSFTAQAAPGPASLSALSVSPASVVGGSGATGTATLTGAAPSGGLVVTLSSSNATVASVPASVTVAAGATSATFPVTTTSVASSTTITLTGVGGGATRTASLTVTPAGGGPLPAPSQVAPASDARFSPGQNLTFDWSDVAGAASYTLQIDDNQTISSPFVLQLTVTPSNFSTSTLPTRTMWWRARANDSAGNPGNWSSVRRFEVKD